MEALPKLWERCNIIKKYKQDYNIKENILCLKWKATKIKGWKEQRNPPPPKRGWPLWWPSGWGTAGAPSWARWSPGPAWWTSRSPAPTCHSGSPTDAGCRCSQTACHICRVRSSSFPWWRQWRRILGQTRRCSAAVGSRSMVSPGKSAAILGWSVTGSDVKCLCNHVSSWRCICLHLPQFEVQCAQRMRDLAMMYVVISA